MTANDTPVGWRANLEPILAAGMAVRRAPAFDEAARSRDVAQRVAEAGRFPLWPVFLALPVLAIPEGTVWASLIVVGWVMWYAYAKRRASMVERQLASETERLRAAAAARLDATAKLVASADAGDAASLRELLSRWLESRPPSVRQITVQVDGRADQGWSLFGEAIRRDDLPSTVPRIGRGGRTFYDKRKAGELDEDVAELNAAAVLSLLIALFSGPKRQRVSVRLMMTNGNVRLPWVTLLADVNGDTLAGVLNPIASAVEAIRRLGGDVGRSRAQRLTAAQSEAGSRERLTSPATATHRRMPTPIEQATVSRVDADPYGGRAAAVDFGEVSPETRSSHKVPDPPPYVIGSPVGLSSAVPTRQNVRGEFSTVARRFAAYRGDANARFVPFQGYWSTYADMTPGQLKFYFKWRQAVRSGEAPRTDLSYIFVHVYELLHAIGADGPPQAAKQLETLWKSYRPTFPKLDTYLVRWIADFYAAEVGTEPALAFLGHAVNLGASTAPDEAMLVVDRYWEKASYADMPSPGLALLAGDPRLGDNKFYREHNRDGWVDRAYREAFAVADRSYADLNKVTPREAAIATDGFHQVAREAFQGAVYDWKRKHVVFGKHPVIAGDSIAVRVYRNAVRHAENLLRAEREFGSRLRGVEIDPVIAKAVESRLGQYIRSTRPRTRIVIDAEKAVHLAKASADVRARLLDGLDTPLDEPEASSVPAPPEQSRRASSAAVPTDAPAGLLTDVEQVKNALSRIEGPSRALIDTLISGGWELPSTATALTQATGGALVAPLVDHVNEIALATIGDVLLVHEDETLVMQEDYRDELYWLTRGTLQGFDDLSSPPGHTNSSESQADEVAALPDNFGALELETLAIIGIADADVATQLAALAVSHATTPLLLLDRVNEAGLTSAYGDLLIEVDGSRPSVIEDAESFVAGLLALRRARLCAHPATDSEDDS